VAYQRCLNQRREAKLTTGVKQLRGISLQAFRANSLCSITLAFSSVNIAKTDSANIVIIIVVFIFLPAYEQFRFHIHDKFSSGQRV
jgi:hypothetical protein